METTPSLKIFVIFHNKLFDENYAELTEAEFSHLTFVAVNENIEKHFSEDKYGKKLIKEWELKQYNPFYQANRYNENGVMKHLYENGLLDSEYIGFAQYDMKFAKNSIHNIIQKLSPNSCFCVLHAPFMNTFNLTCEDEEVKFMKKIFQQFHTHYSDHPKKQYEDYPLLNTFIVHKNIIVKFFPFFIEMFSKFDLQPGLAGILERVTAFALANLTEKRILMDVFHTH